ncbi:hypothetical protein LNO81_22675 [Klebsiella variicola subsp. variicola]|nr:hypothetical protein [Klebsiella variicola subsp. variicola]
MSFVNSNIGRSQNNSKYKKEENCSFCNGSRINQETAQLDVLGFTFDDFLLSPISELCNILKKTIGDSVLIRVLSSINNMGLGYLNLFSFNSQSFWGEIQKLIFSRLLTSNTTGILIVIDEISSQINPIDFEDIFKKLKKLSEKTQ